MEMHCHTPVPKEANRSFHTCVQDVQITRMTTIKVNSSQCYNTIIPEYISYKMTIGLKNIIEQASLQQLF
jgi:hypothetical protein